MVVMSTSRDVVSGVDGGAVIFTGVPEKGDFSLAEASSSCIVRRSSLTVGFAKRRLAHAVECTDNYQMCEV